MDSIRTLLLARTHTVVLDPDRVASAATRPTRDVDLEKFEDELAQLGYVMSLDLAMTIRRLPYQALVELRAWIMATLARSLGTHHPHVPLFRGIPTAGDNASLYLRRMLTWLATRPAQPCPWCAQIKPLGALDPCGHLVCRSCWDSGAFAGCPICHRRVAIGDPFVRAASTIELATHHDGQLRLLHLGFDVMGAARSRFEQLVSRPAPLSLDDRAEVETVIDAMGPRTVHWLPIRIPVKETMAVTLARLWTVAPDRTAMVNATRSHLTTATDVLPLAAARARRAGRRGGPARRHPRARRADAAGFAAAQHAARRARRARPAAGRARDRGHVAPPRAVEASRRAAASLRVRGAAAGRDARVRGGAPEPAGRQRARRRGARRVARRRHRADRRRPRAGHAVDQPGR